MKLQDFLTPTLVAALVAASFRFLRPFVTLRTSERRIQIENITRERAKWREKIRTKSNRGATGMG